MRFEETGIAGAYLVRLDKIRDERGFFAREWCTDELRAHGLAERFVQSNISFSAKRGTLRGLHYQVAPYQEAKLIRCTRGAIFDVVLDLRVESRTYKQWIGVPLEAGDDRMLYVPEGTAHGFQTLADGTEVNYPVSQPYTPTAERGVRYDDPAFNIAWPLDVTEISPKDKRWPDHFPAEPVAQGDEQRGGSE